MGYLVKPLLYFTNVFLRPRVSGNHQGKRSPSRCLECSEICIVLYLLQGWTLWPYPMMSGSLMLSFSLSFILFYTDGTFRALVLIRHLTWRFKMVWSEKDVFFFFFFPLVFVASSSLLLEHGSVQDYYIDGDAQWRCWIWSSLSAFKGRSYGHGL